jgi:DNA end-binding protein Ku
VLLRRTLEATDRTAIVHFALRQKTRLGALRVYGDVLLLQSLLWDDEVRQASFPALDERVRISAQELEMSAALVESFESDFSPEKFSDDYQNQLRELIDAKLAHGDAVSTDETFGRDPEEESEGEVLDLMEALKRSIESSRSGKKAPAKKAASSAKSSSAKSPSTKSAAATTSAKSTTTKQKAPASSNSKKSGSTDAATKAG